MRLNIELEALKVERTKLVSKINSMMKDGSFFRQNGKAAYYTSQMDIINRRISDIEQVQKFELHQRQNKHLMSWLGKTLSLVINTADLSVFYMESAQAYFKTQGLEPKDSMHKAMEDVSRSLTALRKEFSKLLEGDKDANYEDFDKLEQLITKNIFTDREIAHKKEYEK